MQAPPALPPPLHVPGPQIPAQSAVTVHDIPVPWQVREPAGPVQFGLQLPFEEHAPPVNGPLVQVRFAQVPKSFWQLKF